MTNQQTKDTYLIIGAGPVGLAYAKELKLAGIPYHQVEADDNIGGNWYHGVYETAHIISPRDVMQYSDYPMPMHYPEFPSRQYMIDYYTSYVEDFGLRDGIEFQKKVIFIRPIENNLWEVHFESGEERIYKAVLVCNGHHWQRRMPEFVGHFSGEIIHAKDYKKPSQLFGKRIVVIGAGNSACDLASEAARVGKSAYISIRSSAWFLPKLIMGQPLSRFSKPWVPEWVQRLGLKIGLKIVVGDMENYGLPKPDHKVFEKHPTIGTEALHYIKHGRLKSKPGIKELAGEKVIFTDGSEVEADMIVAATGYYLSYPFLPEKLQRVKGAVAQTYGSSMFEDYKGLYLIGWEQARGGVGALAPSGAKLMVELLGLQDKLTFPIGLSLKNMGYKQPNTHLIGMFQVLKDLKKLEKDFPSIRKMDARLRKEQGDFVNQVLALPEILQKDLVVY